MIRCVNCRRRARPDEDPEDEWRAYSDGVGELHVCPECARREFADDAGGTRRGAVVLERVWNGEAGKGDPG